MTSFYPIIPLGNREGVAIHGGWAHFSHFQCLKTQQVFSIENPPEHTKEWLSKIQKPLPDFAGLSLTQPRIQGILNVTPDSFSDGGNFLDVNKATDHGLKMWADGADIVDIGGESTRPGAIPVPPKQECDRILPVIENLAKENVRISVDSRNLSTIQHALASGAKIVNDVTAMQGKMDELGKINHPTIAMHMMGTPQNMQENPVYENVILDVYNYLDNTIKSAVKSGFSTGNLAIDVGIGFGKTVNHNLALLKHLAFFHGIGCAIVLGVSRKSFIAKLTRDVPAHNRLAGSLASGLWGVMQGCHILRVHDVLETRDAITMIQEINS